MSPKQSISPSRSSKKRRITGKIWLVVGVLLGLGALASWFGPAIWARLCEKRWERFRSEWVAKGEDFGIDPYLSPPVPAVENAAMHPFIRKLEKKEPELLRKTGEMSEWLNQLGWWAADDPEEKFTGYAHVFDEHPERLEKFEQKIGKYDAELDAFAEAMARPRMAFPFELKIESGEPLMGSVESSVIWLDFGKGICCRAAVSMAKGKRNAFVADARTLIRTSEHLLHEPSMLCQVVGVGLSNLVANLVSEALDRDFLSGDQYAVLAGEMVRDHPSLGRRVARTLRFERGVLLGIIDSVGPAPPNPAPWPRSISWLSTNRRALARALCAQSRLAACVDLQEILLAPEGTVLREVRPEDFPAFENAVEKRFDGENPFESLAAPVCIWPRLLEHFRRNESERNEVLKRLKQ